MTEKAISISKEEPLSKKPKRKNIEITEGHSYTASSYM
jgi:hypothetical protein